MFATRSVVFAGKVVQTVLSSVPRIGNLWRGLLATSESFCGEEATDNFCCGLFVATATKAYPPMLGSAWKEGGLTHTDGDLAGGHLRVFGPSRILSCTDVVVVLVYGLVLSVMTTGIVGHSFANMNFVHRLWLARMMLKLCHP